MRVHSIAICVSLAAALTACAEEEASIRIGDASVAADGGARDAGARDGGGAAPTGLGGIDASVPAAKLPVDNDGDWAVFTLDGGIENPAASIEGTVSAKAIDGGMEVTLEVENLPAGGEFGSHLHQLPCDEQQGGPHYQNQVPPAGTAATDPKFANEQNELWLDFMTDVDGQGFRKATVPWVPRRGGANSIVVHERVTGPGGAAGGRLACTNLPFTD